MFETSRERISCKDAKAQSPKDFSGKAVVSYFIHCAFAPLREIRFLASALGFVGGGC
jgi:hypothetical protein